MSGWKDARARRASFTIYLTRSFFVRLYVVGPNASKWQHLSTAQDWRPHGKMKGTYYYYYYYYFYYYYYYYYYY
jgi:hypothetical protein